MQQDDRRRKRHPSNDEHEPKRRKCDAERGDLSLNAGATNFHSQTENERCHRRKKRRSLSPYTNDECATKQARTENIVNIHDDSDRLLRLYETKRKEIIEEVEPDRFIDHIDEIDLQQSIHRATGRKERIQMLIKSLDEMSREQKIKILKLISTEFPIVFSETEETTSAVSDAPSSELRILLTEGNSRLVQDVSTEANHPETKLKEIKEVERHMTEKAKSNDKLIDLLNRLTLAVVRKITHQSIKINFSNYSDEEIKKLKECCRNGTAKALIISMLDDTSVQKLNSNAVTEARVEVYIDDACMQFSDVKCGCLCVINKIFLEENKADISRCLDGIEVAYINKLTESEILEEELNASLETIRENADISSIKQKLIDFLFQDNIPQESFCLLENVLKSNGRTVANIKKQGRKKADKTGRHMAIRLSKGKPEEGEELGGPNVFSSDHKKRTKNELMCAIISSYGKMLEDLEPLALQRHLDRSYLEELQFSSLQNVYRRRERVQIFLGLLLKENNSETISAVIDAMQNRYGGVVNAIKTVLDEGSLCEYYRCPRLKGPFCVFSTKISLVEAGNSRIELTPTTLLEKVGCEKQRYSDTNTDSATKELLEQHVRLVKLYSLFKEEMSKSSTSSIANHLYETGHLSAADVTSILECKRRREAVDRLLKLILTGTLDRTIEFKKALQTTVKYLSKRLTEEKVSDMDIKAFSSLAQRRRDNKAQKAVLTEGQCQILNDDNTLDKLNDLLLAKLQFSIREHTDIGNSPFENKTRLTKLIDTMSLYTVDIEYSLCEILNSAGMSSVAKKLKDSREMDQEMNRQLLSPSLEKVIVSYIQRSASDSSLHDSELNRTDNGKESEQPTAASVIQVVCFFEPPSDAIISISSNSSIHQATKQFGFNVEGASRGRSIVLQLAPKGPDSWHELEKSCRTEKIKDFVPTLFQGIPQNLLKEGEYRLSLKLYSFIQLGEKDFKKAVIYLDNEEKDFEVCVQEDSPLAEHLDFLCEELDFTHHLLEELKCKQFIDKEFEENLLKYETRSERNRYLLTKIFSLGKKGYELLKEFTKETNGYLFNYLVANRETMVKKEKTLEFEDTDIGPSSSQSQSHDVKKELLFSCTVVLHVKEKDVGVKPGTSKRELDVSCPRILNPVSKFKSTDTRSTALSSTSESEKSLQPDLEEKKDELDKVEGPAKSASDTTEELTKEELGLTKDELGIVEELPKGHVPRDDMSKKDVSISDKSKTDTSLARTTKDDVSKAEADSRKDYDESLAKHRGAKDRKHRRKIT